MKPSTRNFIILAALVIIDQLLKFWVSSARPSIDAGIFSLRYVTNTGASFGMLRDNNTALIFVSLMVLGIIMMNVKHIQRKHELPMILIISGLVGNLIDRIFRGFVVDFLDLHWWPVFNLADSCIVIGAVWLAAAVLLEKDEKEDKSKKQSTEKKKR
ncbi:MAG: signal peptidase II [archaeon]